MQTQTQYTRCPQCKTAFKVTEKMLSMAHGKVRCGACLQVFQATDYLLQPRTADSDSPSSVRPAHKDSPVSKPVSKFDELNNAPSRAQASLFSDNGMAERSARPSSAESSSEATIKAEPEPEPEPEFTFDPEHETDAEPQALTNNHREPQLGDIDNVSADLDESLDELSTESEASINGSRAEEEFAMPPLDNAEVDWRLPEEPTSDEQIADPQTPAELETDLSYPDAVDPTLSEDSMWASDLDDETTASGALDLDDDFIAAIDGKSESSQSIKATEENLEANDLDFFDRVSAAPPPVDESAAETQADTDNGEFLDPDLSELDFPSSVQEETPSENSDEAWDKPLDESLDSDHLALAESDELGLLSDNLAGQIKDSDTQPDPLDEFEGRVERKKTSLRTLTISAVFVGLLGILGTNFWTNRQTLAWDDTWGAMTQTLCNLLPCDLKPRRDVAKIRLRQRIVTPSESKENALDVKILLTNEASFEQPYPQITIKFSNSLGEPVAVQRFAVADYFPEKQGSLMPAGSEVHIAFTTELPHPDALGFEFSFD